MDCTRGVLFGAFPILWQGDGVGYCRWRGCGRHVAVEDVPSWGCCGELMNKEAVCFNGFYSSGGASCLGESEVLLGGCASASGPDVP